MVSRAVIMTRKSVHKAVEDEGDRGTEVAMSSERSLILRNLDHRTRHTN